jgi:hypothetical protein
VTIALPRPRPANANRSPLNPSQICDGLSPSPSPLEQRVANLEARVAILEQQLASRVGPRDQADAQVLVEIAALLGSARFTSRQIIELAQTQTAETQPLADALEAADLVTGYDVGHLLARVKGQAIDELRVERLDVGRAGTSWRITAA